MLSLRRYIETVCAACVPGSKGRHRRTTWALPRCKKAGLKPTGRGERACTRRRPRDESVLEETILVAEAAASLLCGFLSAACLATFEPPNTQPPVSGLVLATFWKQRAFLAHDMLREGIEMVDRCAECCSSVSGSSIWELRRGVSRQTG